MTLADDGSDSALEAGLRKAPDALWQGLLEAARTYLAEPAAAQVRWVRPKPLRSELRGEETVSYQLGYPVYSGTVNRIVGLFSEVDVVCPFDWPGWDGRDRYRGGAGLAAAPVADAVRLATTQRREILRWRHRRGHRGRHISSDLGADHPLVRNGTATAAASQVRA